MKIAVFSDIHSNYLVFKKAYDDALAKNIDMFLFLGDYVTDGFDANKIIKIIKESSGYAINGNRELSVIDYNKNKSDTWDKYIQYRSMKYGYECLSKESLEFIDKLPIYKILKINGKKICISHSSPYSVRGNVFKDSYDVFDKLIEDFGCDIYLFGHEHKYYYTEYKNRYFINVGSIGLPTDGLPFKYGILNLNEKIEYEKIGIDFNYKELEEYYKSSDFYKEITLWCNLLLENLKKGEDHCGRFLNYVSGKAKANNININIGIPNDLFIKCYHEYFDRIKH